MNPTYDVTYIIFEAARKKAIEKGLTGPTLNDTLLQFYLAKEAGLEEYCDRPSLKLLAEINKIDAVIKVLEDERGLGHTHSAQDEVPSPPQVGVALCGGGTGQ